MNNPPFSIGQKVVALKSFPGYIVKDKTYEVAEIGCCPNHGWHVTLKDLPSFARAGMECTHCSLIVINTNKFKGCHSRNFAPIQTNYSDATSEILEKFKSPAETPDKILTPEKVKV